LDETIPNPDDAKTHITLAPVKLETLINLIQRMPCHDAEKLQTIGLECKEKTPAEEAIDMTLLICDKLNEGFNLRRDLSVKLKTINRDQKASAREMQSVRSTLRSIQGLKI
jgi:hypothetical protein